MMKISLLMDMGVGIIGQRKGAFDGRKKHICLLLLLLLILIKVLILLPLLLLLFLLLLLLLQLSLLLLLEESGLRMVMGENLMMQV